MKFNTHITSGRHALINFNTKLKFEYDLIYFYKIDL